MSTQKARDFASTLSPAALRLAPSFLVRAPFDLDELYMAQMLGVIELLRSDQVDARTSRAPMEFSFLLKSRRRPVQISVDLRLSAFACCSFPLLDHDIDGARRHRQPRKGFARPIPQ